MARTSKAAALSTRAAHRDPSAAAIYPAVFLIFIARKEKSSHIYYFFFEDVSALRGTRVWGPSRSDASGGGGGEMCTLSPPVFSFQNNAVLQWEITRNQPL